MGCPLLVGAHCVVGHDQTLTAPRDGVVERLTEEEIVFDGEHFPLPPSLPDWQDPLTGRRPARVDLIPEGRRAAEGEPLIQYDTVVFNSAYLFRPDGPTDPIERYDKMHLVPFGEYVPLKKWLWFVLPAVPYAKGFDASDRAELFRINGFTCGVLICFEDAFARVVRRFIVRDDGPGADFLINISNDGWFRDSSELDQHLAICALRAVEFRTGIVRCTNTGISGILGPDGRLQAVVQDEHGRRKAVRGVALGRVRLRTETTFYARHGDLLGVACYTVLLAALLAWLFGAFAHRLRRASCA
jgi:apolipoprotein N-acyltransferase